MHGIGSGVFNAVKGVIGTGDGFEMHLGA